jgi:hypothetical protein
MQQNDFFSAYLEYSSDTEVPKFFHRWSAIAGLGAYLGRGFYLSHGHFELYSNIYCMLIGVPGTRKSTAIKQMKSLLQKAGYTTIAADKTTKEKFLLDLAGEEDAVKDIDSINIFGDNFSTEAREILIAADEFNDFIGLGNLEFISLLGSLWDYSGVYKNRIKTGKSVSVCNPTVSILGGNTHTGFSQAFPLEAMGQGFFSRLLLIHSEPSGRKITFPSPPEPAGTAVLIEILQRIKSICIGPAIMNPTAMKLLDKIYKNWVDLDDPRFASYSNRRFTHLLKLCLIFAASRCSREIGEYDVVYANTVLSHTEHLMPKALGEFGKAKHSDVVHKIMQLLESAHEPQNIKDIWKHVIQDLEKLTDLADILRNLAMAEKIQTVQGGFLPKKKVLIEVTDDILNYSLLTAEELGK